MNSKSFVIAPFAAAVLLLGATTARADCASLPNWSQLKAALTAAVVAESSGLDFQMWATVVDRDGTVCAVAFSGADRGAQWPGSRIISAQKANTANAFSLDGLALSTANLYSAVQPGGSLYGLQHSNPVNTDVAYGGNAVNHGMANDFMTGKKIGDVIHIDDIELPAGAKPTIARNFVIANVAAPAGLAAVEEEAATA